MAYGYFQDINRKTTADKVLHHKAFDKKSFGRTVKNKIISNKELTEESHKSIIKKFTKRKVHSAFIDKIWGADLVDMKLISKFKKEFRFVMCY